IQTVNEELKKLHQEFDGLRVRLNTTTRVAASPPNESPAATGRIEMVNTFPTEMSIVINGRSYIVPPFETRMSETIPAGPFTYEVLGVRPAVTRTLAANKVYQVWVHPQ